MIRYLQVMLVSHGCRLLLLCLFMLETVVLIPAAYYAVVEMCVACVSVCCFPQHVL